MSFPNSNFEGNFSTYVFVKSFRYFRKLKIEFWTARHTLCEKILNPVVCVEVRIIVEKLNVYEGHIFPSPFLKTCRLETTSLYLNTRLFVNKNFQILKIFIEINLNFCLLCAHHVIKSLILHTRDLTVNKNSVTHLVFIFRLTFIFRILRT